MPSGVALMFGGVAAMRGGVAIAAAAETECCCEGGCVPPSTAPDCGAPCIQGATRRARLIRVVNGVQTVVWSVTRRVCCGDIAQRQATVRATVIAHNLAPGPCQGTTYEAVNSQGSGTGTTLTGVSVFRFFPSGGTGCIPDPQSVPFATTIECGDVGVGLPFGFPNGLPVNARNGYYFQDGAGNVEWDFTDNVDSDPTQPPVNQYNLWQGNIRVTLPDCVPDVGACCCDGRCYGSLSRAECAAMGGAFRGAGSNCEGVICPNERPKGACCKPDGTCVRTGQFHCTTVLQGVYQGDGTNCDETVCPPPPTRACCLPNGSCIETTHINCQTLDGEWSPTLHCVDPGVCAGPPLGACCTQSGAGALCNVTTAAECLGNGGRWQGGANCDDPNARCLGACCRPGTVCPSGVFCNDTVGQVYCESQGGRYLGPGSQCQGGGFCDDPRCQSPGPAGAGSFR